MRLKNKVALITSSSQGIGRGIAERFAAEGADIVINYSGNAARAQEALQAVEAAGRRGLTVQAEVGKTDDLKKLFATALEHFGSERMARNVADALSEVAEMKDSALRTPHSAF